MLSQTNRRYNEIRRSMIFIANKVTARCIELEEWETILCGLKLTSAYNKS